MRNVPARSGAGRGIAIGAAVVAQSSRNFAHRCALYPRTSLQIFSALAARTAALRRLRILRPPGSVNLSLVEFRAPNFAKTARKRFLSEAAK